MKLYELREGVFDSFRKDKQQSKLLPVTPEQRSLIKQFFRDTNADLRYGGADSKYVLDLNVHAGYGRGRVSFRNEGGVLKASVAFHKNKEDRISQSAMPIIHYDVTINSPADMEKLIKELS